MKVNSFFARTIVLILLVFLGMESCSERGEIIRQMRGLKNNSVPVDIAEIQKRGKLIVLAENSSTSFFIYRGKKMGFEYELLEAFANEINVPLEIRIVENLDDLIRMLNNGEGDLIACNYTVNRKRAKKIDFSVPFIRTQQVLIQRKPSNFWKLSVEEREKAVIRDPIHLAHKKVHVWKNSSYCQRLNHLQEEIGEAIYIQKESGIVSAEDLIQKVSEGTIDYTVAEENVALINENFYPNIDTRTPLSIRQKIAFGLRKNSPELKKTLNSWLKNYITSRKFLALRTKYFSPEKSTFNTPNYSANILKGELSPFDKLFKEICKKHGWDWHLTAALAYQETKFNPNAVGFGGAYSIMQFMPNTGPKYGVYPDSPVETQIEGGVRKLKRDFNEWKEIPDSTQRLKFTLATYNAGKGHVQDAQRLAKKHGLNHLAWDGNVEMMILSLSKGDYYRDGVVKFGALRGSHTHKYVRSIYSRYLEWKAVYTK
jgi:membrane-bound lytic murein transglycosylase F